MADRLFSSIEWSGEFDKLVRSIKNEVAGCLICRIWKYGRRMRYLVKARVKPGRRNALLKAIRERTLGAGSIAGGEYQRDMKQARAQEDGTVCWVETCFCATPLEEERPYWEEYFDLAQIKDAHDRRRCRDLNGEEPWACCNCDCTRRLEQKMQQWGEPFLDALAGR